MQDILTKVEAWSLIRTVGGVAAITSALVTILSWLIRDWVSHRLKTKQLREIEDLRHRFSKSETLLSGLAATIANAQVASSDRRLDHFQTTWDGMMQIREAFPALTSLAASILTKQEVEEIPASRNEFTKTNVRNFAPDKFFDTHFSTVSKVERSRPFIGHRAWSIFYAYQALHGRLVVLAEKGLKAGKITHWVDDVSFIEQVLGIAIGEDELRRLIENEMTAYQNVRNYLEVAIVNETAAHALGTKAAEQVVTEALKLTEAGSILH